MLESRIIEVDGTFVGTLIVEADRVTRRFYATHDSVRAFHNRTLRGSEDLTHQVARLYRTGITTRQARVHHRKQG